jgi:hypothetical protein
MADATARLEKAKARLRKNVDEFARDHRLCEKSRKLLAQADRS